MKHAIYTLYADFETGEGDIVATPGGMAREFEADQDYLFQADVLQDWYLDLQERYEIAAEDIYGGKDEQD